MKTRRSALSNWARLFPVCAVLFAAVSISWLLWLLWVYVPVQLEVFATFGISLSGPAGVVVQTINIFLRSLPFIVIVVSVAASLLGFPVARHLLLGNRSIVHLLSVGAIVVALSGMLASGLIVWGLHTAYAQASADGVWSEAARRLDFQGTEDGQEKP